MHATFYSILPSEEFFHRMDCQLWSNELARHLFVAVHDFLDANTIANDKGITRKSETDLLWKRFRFVGLSKMFLKQNKTE